MPKPKLNPEDARQGEKGTSVLMILVVGLALCAVIFVGLGIYGWWLPDADMAVDGPVPTGSEPVDPATQDGGTVSPSNPANP